MRKVSKKRRLLSPNSLRPVRHYLADGVLPVLRWAFEGIPYSDPAYEKHIKFWLDDWTKRGVSMLRGMMTDPRYYCRQDPTNWQEKIAEPGIDAKEKELLDWITSVTTGCDSTLRRLLVDYKVSPIPVLDILGAWKIHFLFYREAMAASRLLGSEKVRKQHAKKLFEAVDILNAWKPISFQVFPVISYPEPWDIHSIATTLLEYGPSQPYRPEEIEVKMCARELSSLFQRETTKQLPDYVGQLLAAAFPDRWVHSMKIKNGAVKIKDAAKKLLKDRKAKAKPRFDSSRVGG